jgi:hypothetical protein
MTQVKTAVDDNLLKTLSIETRKIGTKVLVKKSVKLPEYTADIIDVIIIPQEEFYRRKFMQFYKSCEFNSVKALKELANNFLYTPDFELGIGYILNVNKAPDDLMPSIKIKSEIETIIQAPR